jgi:ribosomal protein L30E
MAETRDLRMKELLGQHAVLTLPEIQLEFKTHNAGIGMNITKAEVGVLAILDLGDSALTAAEFGSHLRLGKTGSHPGDDELID